MWNKNWLQWIWNWLLLDFSTRMRLSQSRRSVQTTDCFWSCKMWPELMISLSIIEVHTGLVGRLWAGEWRSPQRVCKWVSLSGETERERGRTDSGSPPSKMASPEENEWKILKRGLLSLHFLVWYYCFPHYDCMINAEWTRRRASWVAKDSGNTGSEHSGK